MQFHKTPIALAFAALSSTVPLAAQAAPTVSFRAPAAGATISSNIYQSSACEVTGSNIRRVVFSLVSSSGATTALNTELTAPWNCNIDPRRFTTGAYTLRAVAYDATTGGASATATRSINIQNGTTPPPPPPPSTNTPPNVSFRAPLAGATVRGWLDGATCEALAADSNGISQVQFFLDSTALNIERVAPYNCSFNTANFPDGAHTLRAVATDGLGATGTGQISVTIQNGTTPPPPANTPPSVSFTAPAAGATLTGTAAAVAANATDTNGSVAKVDFYVGSTLAATRTASPYQAAIDTTRFTNGTYNLMAVATDNQGASASTTRSVSISNTAPPPPPLPSTGTRAVPTFESLGLYWRPGTNPGSAGCGVRYRKQGESDWKQGLAMWYDSRDSECRGSLVHLAPGSDYEVQFNLPGQQPSAALTAKTWSESFPIARTVQVQSGSGTLNITEGGTPNGYVLYTGPATLDAANGADYNIRISAPYVIVRGLTLRGARIDAIRMVGGAHDVVIEDNDISGWGRFRTTLSNGWQVGVDRDSAVRADCRASGFTLERTVVQRNRIHDPRYTTNAWDWGHPLGPQAVTYSYCGGNHVIRHNEVFSSDGSKYLNDAFSGEDNFSADGFPHSDSDIYGNRISHVWDDAVEAEGLNRNVRIWGNYLDNTGTGIATTVAHAGPVYIFRNVYNRSRKEALKSTDAGDRLTFAKSGTTSGYGNGRRYIFHNTLLQATQAGSTYPLGSGGGISAGGSTQPLTNTVSRNNILHVWKSGWNSVASAGGANNDLDYDLRNGGVSAYSGAEANGIVGTPIYAPGNGWQSESNGMYQLAPGSPGYARGVRIPNFNDGAAAPDVGAHQSGMPAMRFGLQGGSAVWPSGSSPVAESSSTSSVGSGGTGSGGVCSTLVCAATQ